MTPPRPGMQRLLAPYEYRHAAAFGRLRIVGGGIGVAAGLICIAYSVYGWAAFFLAIGALNVAGGIWELSISRSAPARR